MRYKIFIVDLNPTIGAEMNKTRPCVVITPNVMNDRLKTVGVAPLTSNINGLPFRTVTNHNGRESSIALDQFKTIDKSRLIREVGELSDDEAADVRRVLMEMFEE